MTQSLVNQVIWRRIDFLDVLTVHLPLTFVLVLWVMDTVHADGLGGVSKYFPFTVHLPFALYLAVQPRSGARRLFNAILEARRTVLVLDPAFAVAPHFTPFTITQNVRVAMAPFPLMR